LSVSTASHSALPDSAFAAAPARRATFAESAVKTTEVVIYLVAVAAVVVSSYLVGDVDGRGDVFLADKAWFYVTLLTIGYVISRGLADAGGRHHDA